MQTEIDEKNSEIAKLHAPALTILVSEEALGIATTMTYFPQQIKIRSRYMSTYHAKGFNVHYQIQKNELLDAKGATEQELEDHGKDSLEYLGSNYKLQELEENITQLGQWVMEQLVVGKVFSSSGLGVQGTATTNFCSRAFRYSTHSHYSQAKPRFKNHWRIYLCGETSKQSSVSL